MKKRIILFLSLFFCLIANALNKIDHPSSESTYPTIVDKFGNNIFFETHLSDEEHIKVYQLDAKKESKKLISEMSYLNQPPQIAFVFFVEIKNRGNYLFISQSIQPNYNGTGIPYVDNYFLNKAFKLSDGYYKLDEELSDFFGDGGDIYNIEDINNEKISRSNRRIIYSYPYKNEIAIISELKSDFFKNWNSKRIKKGTVLRKTLLQNVPNYVQNEKKYLIKGDDFLVNSVSTKWLEVTYKNVKKNVTYTGWILCKDTSVCQ